MATSVLPRFMLIKSNNYSDKGYAYCKEEEGGCVVFGEESVFSTLVKIEVERATSNNKYVHLRFCYSNRYWQRKENDKLIIAESKKPEEDTTKSSCTLLEPIKANDSDAFYLRHVGSGGRLLLRMNNSRLAFYVASNSDEAGSLISFVDWDTLVKLPKNVAFKGYNGSYLGGIWAEKHPYLQFSVDQSNTPITTYQIHPIPDGHVRIYSNYFNNFCRRSPNWIWADSSDSTANDKDTLFWPVRIDDNAIALRNAGNNRFCIGLDADNKTRCLNAAAPNITDQARIVVQELVRQRKIYNVRYRMEDARIFNETPFSAGTASAINNGDREASVAVAVTYQDSKSYSFSRSASLTAGVATSIKAGVPVIQETSIQISFQVNTTFQWDQSKTTTTSVTATGSVPVPPKSVASVRYVGTMGTCDVPFSYTQHDQSSTDGKITQTDHIDGLYTGVSCYNFTFVVGKTQPLTQDKTRERATSACLII